MNQYSRSSVSPIGPAAAQLGDWVAHFAANRLIGPQGETRVTPKAMQVLQLLAAQPFEPVSREVLLDRIWGERYPTDEVITHVINELRRAFGDDARQPSYIQTVPRVGYRLICAVTPLAQTPLPAGATPAEPNDASPMRAQAATATPAKSISRPRVMLAAALGALLLAMGVWYGNTADTVPGVVALRPLTSDRGREMFPALSPDGRRVAYIAMQSGPMSLRAQLLVREVEGGEARVLAQFGEHGEQFRAPTWSPDSREVATMQVNGADCRIVAIAIDTRAQRELGRCRAEDAGRARMAWSPDGAHIALAQRVDDAQGYRRIHLLDVRTGALAPLAVPIQPDRDAIDPQYAPDGARLAWRALHQQGTKLVEEIMLAPSAGGAAKRVLRSEQALRGIAWHADGKALTVSVLEAQGPRLHTLNLDEGVLRALDLPQTAAFPSHARSTASLVFITYAAPRPANIVIQDLGWPVPGIKQEHFASTRRSAAPRWSPDGQRIAFASDRDGHWQIWLGSVAADAPVRALTHWQGETRPLEHQWRADGKAVLVAYTQDGQTRIAEFDVDGSAPRLLYQAAQDVNAFAQRGADHALYVAPAGPGDTRLIRITADGTRETLPLADVASLAFDQDETLLFTRVDDSGLWRATPQDWQAERLPGITRCDEFTAWALHAEGVVYWAYIEGGEALMLAPRADWAHPRVFTGLVGPYANRDFVLSPDGQRVALVADSEPEADIMLARLN